MGNQPRTKNGKFARKSSKSRKSRSAMKKHGFKKGNIPWNTGKHLSEDHKQKLRDAWASQNGGQNTTIFSFFNSFVGNIWYLIFGFPIFMAILSWIGGWFKYDNDGERTSFKKGLENELRNMDEAVKYAEKKVSNEFAPKKFNPSDYKVNAPKRVKPDKVLERYDLEMYDKNHEEDKEPQEEYGNS